MVRTDAATEPGRTGTAAPYACLGWHATPAGQQVAPKPETLFTDKLFKKGKDYRGDAQACLHALPLCVAFGEEILREVCAAMKPALDALLDSYAVVRCIQHTKKNPKAVDNLLNLQKKHMSTFQLAHPDQQRPKLHYGLHITEQVKQHKILLDVFLLRTQAPCIQDAVCVETWSTGKPLFRQSNPAAAGVTGPSYSAARLVMLARRKASRSRVPRLRWRRLRLVPLPLRVRRLLRRMGLVMLAQGFSQTCAAVALLASTPGVLLPRRVRRLPRQMGAMSKPST
eukprot:s1514_g17.t1